MMKKIILVSMVVNYSIISGWGNSPYHNAALNTVDQKVENILNLSTSEVASRAGTETDVAQCFKEELLTDADEDAPISEKRKMQRLMTLIRATYGERPVSGLTLEVSDLYETSALKFDAKEKSLQAEKDGLSMSKLGWGSLTVVGVGGLIVAAKISGDRGNKTAVQVIGASSVFATIVGSGKFISTIGKEGKLETHMTQVRSVKNSWESSFKVK